MLDNRISASTVPHAIPTTMAVPVISRVVFRPPQRMGRAPGMELQSKSYMTSPLFTADETGYASATFDPAHDKHDDHVDQQIQQGDGNKRFVRLGREIHQLLGLPGEFDEADGGRYRRILEDIEEFGGERRHDNTVGHGQQD